MPRRRKEIRIGGRSFVREDEPISEHKKERIEETYQDAHIYFKFVRTNGGMYWWYKSRGR